MNPSEVPLPELSATEASSLLAADTSVVLLDVREADEWAAGHAPNAVHVPLSFLHPGRVPADAFVITVCRSGRRSAAAAQTLQTGGVHVHNLAGGMQAWEKAGLPVRRDDGTPGWVA